MSTTRADIMFDQLRGDYARKIEDMREELTKDLEGQVGRLWSAMRDMDTERDEFELYQDDRINDLEDTVAELRLEIARLKAERTK